MQKKAPENRDPVNAQTRNIYLAISIDIDVATSC